jgi:hypothetical protein
VLLGECVDSRLGRELASHEVKTANGVDDAQEWGVVGAGIRHPDPHRKTHFRATGITAYLKYGGFLGTAQLAAHESPRTDSLYDRRSDDASLDEVERIGI